MTPRRKSISEILKSNCKQRESVLACGLVKTKRSPSSAISFIEINDGSSVQNLQIVAGKNLDNYDSDVKCLQTGSAIEVQGTVENSRGEQEIELHASRIYIHGKCGDDYPIQKKQHSNEFLRKHAHLRPRTSTFAAIARVRNAASYAIHQFFQERHFLYVNTPIITSNDCEGAGEMFQVTTLNLESMFRSDSQSNQTNYENDFFGRKTFLTVSGQLEGEAFACSLGKIYTFGPTFRAENSNTPRHLSEFWMVEPEVAFHNLVDNMDLAEDFVKSVISKVLENQLEDLEFLHAKNKLTNVDEIKSICKKPFERITYTESIDILKNSKQNFQFPIEWGMDLQKEHEKFLTEQHFKTAVIVQDYPSGIKPFYMFNNDDERTVRAMDVLLPRVGELVGGSQREHRFDQLVEKMLNQNIDIETYRWYLDLRKFGSTPHAGFGLGLERLIQYLTGMPNIRDVIPFPRTPKNM